MYPNEELQALETLQDSLALDGDDESQVEKRKPSNNRFFLKGESFFGSIFCQKISLVFKP